MNKKFIEARIDALLSEVRVDWYDQCNQIKASMGKNGTGGGSASVIAAAKAFKPIILRQTDKALAEMETSILHKKSLWYSSHEYLLLQIAACFKDVRQECFDMMLLSSGRDRFGKLGFAAALATAKGNVAAHSIKWNVPAGEGWPSRHPVLFPIMLALFTFALGLAVAPISRLFS